MILQIVALALMNLLNVWVWNQLPSWVWPKRRARAVKLVFRLWYFRKKDNCLNGLRGVAARWMVWRVREHTLWFPNQLTCPACGKRDAHIIQFHAPIGKIVVRCTRCQATWPKDPIYDITAWLPPQPKKKED